MLKQKVKNWRKTPLKDLKIWESNLWLMISEFGKTDYAAEHRALRRFISHYPDLCRVISVELLKKQKAYELFRGYKDAVKRRDRPAAANHAALLKIGMWAGAQRG